jgi:hypothetical protein
VKTVVNGITREVPPLRFYLRDIRLRYGFKNKKRQLPLFMIWKEEWYDGEVVYAWVVFNSMNWIGI